MDFFKEGINNEEFEPTTTKVLEEAQSYRQLVVTLSRVLREEE